MKRLFGRDEEASEADPAPIGWRRRWKRALLLLPLMTGLLFLSIVELGHPAAGKARRGGIMAALADPLALFAARSPGERGGGALLSTKPGRPSERVLSEVRDRDPVNPPALTPDDVAAIPNGLPSDGDFPGGAGGPGSGGAPGGVSPFFAPFTPAGFSDPGDPGVVGSPPPGGGPPGIFPPSPLGGVSAVPEPATWTMLILGFFGAGAALRRARKANPT